MLMLEESKPQSAGRARARTAVSSILDLMLQKSTHAWVLTFVRECGWTVCQSTPWTCNEECRNNCDAHERRPPRKHLCWALFIKKALPRQCFMAYTAGRAFQLFAAA
eukprot:scaffold249498_cov21-Tisochrysis_lutea.AAC.4